MLDSIPPKVKVSDFVGYLKEKSSWFNPISYKLEQINVKTNVKRKVTTMDAVIRSKQH